MARPSGLLRRLGALVALGLTWPVRAAEAQPVKQVAIIGAGAAGSSAAYHLQRYAEQGGIAVNITVFEKTDRVGGRTLTVNPHDDPDCNIELGASLFAKVNHILMNATRDFNLSTNRYESSSGFGVWDGKSFVYQPSNSGWEWWDLTKLMWRYGFAPLRVQRLVRSTVAEFLRMYDAPLFPFRSITSRASELGLDQLTGTTGKQWLDEHDIGALYSREIVQMSTRVNYMSNLPFIHGLGTMVAMAIEGPTAIEGGNWKIFDNMLNRSGAGKHLNTTVSSINQKGGGEPGSPANKYVITTTDSGSSDGQDTRQPIDFDDVIIATPWQFSDIKDDDEVIEHPIQNVSYAKLHVTLFASPFQFCPEFFGLDAGAKVPSSVYTTLGADEEAKPGSKGAGEAGFFSASEVGMVKNPKTNQQEYVYKIFSPDAVTPEFLSRLLGVKVPEGFVDPANHDDPTRGKLEAVSWHHAKVFHPYPQLTTRTEFTDPVIGRGLYYTSGIEPFVSTMETSALMGMNVARLIMDDYLDTSAMGQTHRLLVPGHGGEQVVFGLHEDQEENAFEL